MHCQVCKIASLQLFLSGKNLRLVILSQKRYKMPLGAALLKILNKQYPPSSFVEKRYQRYDLGFKTDEEAIAFYSSWVLKMPTEISADAATPGDF